MRRIMPDLQPVVERIDKLIRDTHDDLQYAIKWKKAYYGLPEQGWIIELVAYDVSVNVVFHGGDDRSEEHTSELQSLMRISYAVFGLEKKNNNMTSRTYSGDKYAYAKYKKTQNYTR